MSWDANAEKLLCHVVLNDSVAPFLSDRAGPAFFRAFIVQNRITGKISMKMRWKYKNDDRNWFIVEPKEQNAGTARELREGIAKILEEASAGVGHPLAPGMVEFFSPPDDGGDCFRTIAWLQEQDLIEVSLEAGP